MTENKTRGILTEVQGINCANVGCLLRNDFGKNSQCQPKAFLDRGLPKTASKRKNRVKRDFGSQIPDNCTLGYNNF